MQSKVIDRTSLVAKWALPAFCVAKVLIYLGETRDHLASFSGYPANGAFQLFNPLRRILAGQVAGADFQFFHGIGVPFFHFPLFVALGADFKASEEARYLLAPLCFVLSTFFFFRVQADRWLNAILLATLSWIALDLNCLEKEEGLFSPGNSLLSVRSFMPVVIAACIALRPKFRSQTLYFMLIGALVAVSLLLGTEAGMGIAVAMIVGHLMIFGPPKTAHQWLNVSTVVGSAAFTLTAFLLLFTHGSIHSILSILHFNFVDVPRDQFWYFGVPPNRFLAHGTDFLNELQLILQVTLGAGLAAICFALIRKEIKSDTGHAHKLLGAFILLLAGSLSLVSYLGMTNPHYLEAHYRALAFAILTLGYRYLRTADRESVYFKPSLKAAFFLSALLCGVVAIAEPIALNALPKGFEDHKAYSHYGRFGLSSSWTQYVLVMHSGLQGKTCRDSGKNLLWSTYSSFFEDGLGCFHPDTDYIIHALGPEGRARYLASFIQSKTEYVQTMRRDFFPYEDWLMFTTWDFYEEVLKNYHVISQTPHSLLWKRLAAGESPDVKMGESVDVSHDGLKIQLDHEMIERAHPDLGVLTLKYAIANPWEKLPVVGMIPRFLLTCEGSANAYAASLNPHVKEMSIPVFFKNGKKPDIEVIVRSLLPGVQIRLEKVSMRPVWIRHESMTQALLASPPLKYTRMAP
jgi:hypothetical protein